MLFEFQSTHPRGVRRRSCAGPPRRRNSFNPRTRVGCDQGEENPPARLPTFQSTHPRGVRPRASARLSQPSRFQSTHPRGVRHGTAWGDAGAAAVSIHAPAWGATMPRLLPTCGGRSFNPRTRVGCDAATIGCCVETMLFQSTHPRGVRLHAPDGRDGFFSVSIHAPAWGATANISQAESVCRVSIHAPAWGATGAGNIIINNDEVFQSTHPRGVRHLRLHAGFESYVVSIHAPAWGATF